MKKNLSLIRVGILGQLAFRMGFVTLIIGNMIYVTIVYFLWRAVFSSIESATVNGMTFANTMLYLVLAGSLFTIMEVYLVWDTHRAIQSGKIINDLIKPVGYRAFLYYPYFGTMACNFVITFIPTFILVYFLSGMAIPLGINLIFFIVSVLMAILINISIDFFVSGILFYTQSAWGINIMKEVIVLLLSGVTIPIAFFPEPLKSIVMYMPFQAIYNAPMTQLLSNLSYAERFISIGVQFVWVLVTFIISEFFWRSSVKQITVNGG